jgi:hypothetical protein
MKNEIAVKPEPPSQSNTKGIKPTNVPKTKPRLSLIERQSLQNRPLAPTKRRTSTLHNPVLPQDSPDIFRFPSESPPKNPQPQHSSPPKPATTNNPATKKPSMISPPKIVSPLRSPIRSPQRSPRRQGEDKENVRGAWPPVQGGRERRRTFNATMEKLQKMTMEEMQGDREWEENLKVKRRRQSVAI